MGAIAGESGHGHGAAQGTGVPEPARGAQNHRKGPRRRASGGPAGHQDFREPPLLSARGRACPPGPS
eukprot:5920744-Alexandrium_andersonii.AAC.1